MSSSSNIIVIGAGVTGLTTATILQQSVPSTHITIIAAETPTTPSPSADYASMWAGAHYRPTHPLTTPQLKAEHDLCMRTAETMKRIAQENPEAGVGLMRGEDGFGEPPEEILKLQDGDVYAWPGDEFQILKDEELPGGVKWGCAYQTYSVNVAIYCRWLMERFVAKGGKVITQRLSSASEAFDFAERSGLGKVDLVVNCSGRNFDLDPKMKIIRGQTVLVKQQYTKTITWQNKDGTWAFLIPRPRNGGTIVGGTKEPDDWEENPRAATRAKLLRQSVESFPEFVDAVEKFEVLKDNVGRRPWREGGYRFEIEEVGKERTVVHGYGAGGRGYECSWGAAEKILELVQEVVAAGKAKL